MPKQAIRKRKVRTVKIGENKYAHVYVVRKPAKRKR